MPLPRPTRLTARTLLVAGTLVGTAATIVACGDDNYTSATGPGAGGTGTLIVQLTDAPFPFDSVKSVDVFVVRIDGKQASTDSADAAKATADGEKDQGGWVTLAEPKAKFDLLTLRDGKTALLGQRSLPTGSYKSLRLIIDPAQSNVTLKSGAAVDVQWPSAGRSGIKVQLAKDVTVGKDSTKSLVVDFDVGESFVMRGNAMRNGLLFKPVIKATTK
jgi:hypothetical protein